jgi:hypothetical protein
VPVSRSFRVITCPSPRALQRVSSPRFLPLFPCPHLTFSLRFLASECPSFASFLFPSSPVLRSFLSRPFCGFQFVSITYFRCSSLFILPLFFSESESFSFLCLFSASLSVLLSVWQDVYSRLNSFITNVSYLSLYFYPCFTHMHLAIPFDT